MDEDLPIPNEFLCPITHEIMTDPVLTMDGHTYDRKAIVNWFERGSSLTSLTGVGTITSPITGAILQSNLLIPNYALKNTINKFHENLPYLKEHLQDIQVMKEKLEQKEKEIREHIQHGLVMVSVMNTAEIVSKLQRTIDLLPSSGETKSSSSSSSPSASSHPATVSTTEIEVEEEELEEVVPNDGEEKKEGTVNSNSIKKTAKNIQLNGTQQCDQLLTQITLTPQEYESYDHSLINSLILHQQQSHEKSLLSIQQEYQQCHQKHQHYLNEIQSYEQQSILTETMIGKLELDIQELNHEMEILQERKSNYELKLHELSQKYCEMAHALMGQSEEISLGMLSNLRKTPPSQEMPKSPILLEYQQIVIQIKEIEDKCQEYSNQILELNLPQHQENSENISNKLTELSLLQTQLTRYEESLHEHESVCHLELQKMSEMKEDLYDAIQWARKDTLGLYQPNLLTLPLLFLNFKLFCRHEVTSSGKDPTELLQEKITPKRLKRWNCLLDEVKCGGYSLYDLKEGGYDAMELKTLWSLSALKDVGFTVEELIESGVTVREFLSHGFTVQQLIGGGYSIQQLYEGGYGVSQLKKAGYTTQQLREAGIS